MTQDRSRWWSSVANGRAVALAGAQYSESGVLIAVAAPVVALAVTRSGDFRVWTMRAVRGIALAVGLGYTVVSERVNAALGHRTSTSTMPVVPVIDAGLSPLAPWVAVPVLTFAGPGWRRRADRGRALERTDA